jgi:hypothetical protein
MSVKTGIVNKRNGRLFVVCHKIVYQINVTGKFRNVHGIRSDYPTPVKGRNWSCEDCPSVDMRAKSKVLLRIWILVLFFKLRKKECY